MPNSMKEKYSIPYPDMFFVLKWEKFNCNEGNMIALAYLHRTVCNGPSSSSSPSSSSLSFIMMKIIMSTVKTRYRIMSMIKTRYSESDA